MAFRKLMFAVMTVVSFVVVACGALPQADENGRITLQESVTVDDEAGVAVLAAASEIVLAEGVRLSYVAAEELELSAKVSGLGVFEAVDAGLITLSADNSGLVSPGQFVFKRTPVLVTSETGLGGGDSGEATFIGNVTNNHLRFVGESAVFTNYAPIVMKLVSASDKGTFYFGSQGADKYLVQAASFTASVDNYKTIDFYFKHNVEFIAGTLTIEKYPYLRRSGAGTVRIGENVDVIWGHSAQAIVYFNGLELACRSLLAETGISPSAANDVRLQRENCFNVKTPLRPYVTWYVQTTWHYNLNGFDQTVARLEAIENVEVENQCAFIGSASPALLKTVGTKAGKQTARWKFEGALSYWHDTPYTNIFTKYKLETTGALTISKGMVGFTDGSGWSGNEVTVKEGGALSCASVASLDSGEHILAVESGAALEVAAGVTLKVRSATIGSVSLPAGKLMSMDEVRALTANEGVSLIGGGSIMTSAESIAGEWAGWPDVGTADFAAIPNGEEVVITDADIEKVQALSSIKTGVDTKILCRTTISPLVLPASISGGVTFEAHNCGTVVLTGDNSGIVAPGAFIFSNTTVVVSNRFGLGGVLTGAANFWPAAPLNANRSVLRFGGDAVTNDVEVVFHYGAYVGHDDPSVRFVQNANLTQLNGSNGSTVQRTYVIGDFTIASGCLMDVFSTHQPADGHFRIEEGAKLKANGNFGNGYYHIAGEITGDLAIEQGMRRFIFERENALLVNSCRFYDGSEKKFYFDLNGFDQAMPRVLGNQYGTTQYQQYFDVTSATPATLTLNAKAEMNSGAAIRCLDQASLVYSGASTQTIGFATSTTSGSLTINSGAIAFERNAKWLGPKVYLNGGTLIVRESAATNTFGVGRETASDFVVAEGAKLELQSNSYTSTVNSIIYNGELLTRGVYTAENCGFITGLGAIRAVRGKPTSVIIVVK